MPRSSGCRRHSRSHRRRPRRNASPGRADIALSDHEVSGNVNRFLHRITVSAAVERVTQPLASSAASLRDRRGRLGRGPQHNDGRRARGPGGLWPRPVDYLNAAAGEGCTFWLMSPGWTRRLRGHCPPSGEIEHIAIQMERPAPVR
jgi:hypothetical protein